VSVAVLGGQSDSKTSKQPPFLLDIRPVENPRSDAFNSKAAIYLAITNRSDHRIAFNIGFGDNDVDVFDSDGNLAPLTEIGRRYRGPLPRGGPPTQFLDPGETKSGGAVNLDVLYNFSPHRSYAVQVKAFDPETKTIVKSNIIFITPDE
jgi:hypothetical protein